MWFIVWLKKEFLVQNMKINIVFNVNLFWHLQECDACCQKCHLEQEPCVIMEKAVRAARYCSYHLPQHIVMKPHFMPLSKEVSPTCPAALQHVGSKQNVFYIYLHLLDDLSRLLKDDVQW